MQFLHEAARECADDLPPGSIDVAALGGSPADVVLQEIDTRGADLVVMRTRGRAGLGRAVLGSVAEGIVQRSPTAVLLLPPQAQAAVSVRTILAPVDGSPWSALALGAARELALVAGARLRLLQIVEPASSYMSHGFAHAPIYIDPLWDQDALAAAQTYVGSLVSRLSGEGLSCEGKVLMESPVPGVIVRDATEQHADVIVMSTEAHTGVARAILGSVTDAVVRTATCPVLVLRRTLEGAGEQSNLNI
jgi:nucleotide-binding universal stress UspA family protein